jgi:glycine oxidase
MAATSDVVVVGGGVIGLATAWRAAQRGLSVAVVDPDPGSGASRVAAGMLAPVTEVHYGEQPLLRLNLASAARYPDFVCELAEASGRDPGYRACGTLAVALDADDRAALDELAAFQTSLGLAIQRLTGRECRRLEPLLAPSVRGGVFVECDHQVDPRRLVPALLAAVERSGVALRRTTVPEVRVVHDRVVGVRLADGGELASESVVLAAGCRSTLVGGLPERLVPPVRPVKGQILRLRAPATYPFLQRNVRGLVQGSPVYLVPRADGEIVLGATMEEQGYDEQVTAGGVYELLRDAHLLLPGISELPLVETAAGLRPGTADNAPLIGPAELPGLVVATGHHRNGILLTPVTADAVAEILATGAVPDVVAAFGPARFTRTGAQL